jgi:hypothetical protein
VQSLNYSDGLLQALPEAVTADFAGWVNDGHYRAVSASIYPKDSPSNPTPGQYYLRHVGFLGGQPPAVKGLPEPAFAEPDLITFDFTEERFMSGPTDDEKQRLAAAQEKLAQREAELNAKEASFAEKETALNTQIVALSKEKSEAQRNETLAFAESLVKEGKLLPKDKAGLVEFMCSQKPTDVLEFGEGDAKTKVPSHTWLKGFLQGLPKVINFGEVSGVDKVTGTPLTDEQIARRARAYHQNMTSRGEAISFTEAVDAVNAGLDGEFK